MVDSKQQWKAWIYLAPTLILLAIFTVWPIINTSVMAFQEGFNEMDALRVGRWGFPIGLGNFAKVLKLNSFKTALSNTIILCVPTVLLSTLLALIISVCLNSIKAFNRFLQTIYFLPYVTNSIAIGMVFTAMFNIVGNTAAANPIIDSYGIINTVLQAIGFEPINWVNSGSTYEANMAVMIIYIIWNALPFKILVLLGALQSVNKQYYDAAKVDGTGKVRTFTRITVPLLSPMITYVVITGFIGGFKEYSSIVGVFGDDMGPTGGQGRLNTMVGLIYEAIEKGNTGNASAAALILFGIIFIITMINLAISKKTTYY